MTQGIEEIIRGTLTDLKLTYPQRLTALAGTTKNTSDSVPLSREAQWFVDRSVVSDMGEGNVPYRPRYVLPDYDKFMRQGSRFPMLDPPGGMWDTASSLLILYRHVPSVIAGLVYIGHTDRFLGPFVKDEEEARYAIGIFLAHVDHTISDSFCYVDIGLYDTKAGKTILELSVQMQRPVPSMSLIYDEYTTDEFTCEVIETGLVTAESNFVNDAMYTAD